MGLTSFGLLLTLVGSIMLTVLGVRWGVRKESGYFDQLGSRWGNIAGWVLIVIGFALQFVDSLRQG